MNEDVPCSFSYRWWEQAREANFRMNYKFSADGFDSPEDWADNNEDPDYVELAEAGESKWHFYYSEVYQEVKCEWIKKVEGWKKELTITLETGKSFTSNQMAADQRRILQILAEELGLQSETIKRRGNFGRVRITTKPLLKIKKEYPN